MNTNITIMKNTQIKNYLNKKKSQKSQQYVVDTKEKNNKYLYIIVSMHHSPKIFINNIVFKINLYSLNIIKSFYVIMYV